MARAGLGWSIDRLAKEARVGAATVARFETGKGETIPATVAAMRRALEAGGVEFLPDNGIRLGTAAAADKDTESGMGGTEPPPPDEPGNPAPQPRKRSEPKAAPAQPISRPAQLRALREQSIRGIHVG